MSKTTTTKPKLTREQKQAAFEAAIPERTVVDLPDDTKIDTTTIQKIAGPRYEVETSKSKGGSYAIVKREGRTVAYATETLFKIPRDLSDFDASLKVNAAGEAYVEHANVRETRKALRYAETAPVSKRKAVVK